MARLSFVYLLASIVYLIATRCIGTPFKDSLTEEQMEIKACSSKKRGLIFLIGIVVGIGVLICIRPFHKKK